MGGSFTRIPVDAACIESLRGIKIWISTSQRWNECIRHHIRQPVVTLTFDHWSPKSNQVINRCLWSFPWVPSRLLQTFMRYGVQKVDLDDPLWHSPLSFWTPYNLTTSSVWATEYSLSALSKLFKPLMRYHGNNRTGRINERTDEWDNGTA